MQALRAESRIIDEQGRLTTLELDRPRAHSSACRWNSCSCGAAKWLAGHKLPPEFTTAQIEKLQGLLGVKMPAT